MRFDKLSKKLGGIEDASKKGRPVNDLFKLMINCKEIWVEAYANIYSNQGAITKGVNSNTLDGFSDSRVEQIINQLKSKTYKFSPVRRVYIPKRRGNSFRPLGLPTGDDKLVQEVARILLERVYEPIFSDNSHGFRPNRSCHTALEKIHKTWTGVKWFIEFDIKGFFDNMDHSVLIRLLEKKISDKRFIKLIRSMLKAGYLQEWTVYPTYSGTPQGGVISPILSNVYLHELGTFMLELEKEFTTGKRRKQNPAHTQISYRKTQIRKEIDRVGRVPELIKELRSLDKIQKSLPSYDPYDWGYKRLRYCRYADDFVAGIIGSKDDARQITEQIKTFIADKLQLEISPDKTGITSSKEGMQFLGYTICAHTTDKIIRCKRFGRYTTQRVTPGSIRLGVPGNTAQRFCQKYGYGDWQKNRPLHRPHLEQASDAEILSTYNAELRGLANYYAFASNVKSRLAKLQYLAHYSFFKTLAKKHKTRKAKIIAQLKEGNEFVLKYSVKGKEYRITLFKLKHMKTTPKDWTLDEMPNMLHLTSARSELVKRLNYGECEYCRRTDLPLESHHVRKLNDLRKKPHLQKWQERMIAMNRKTLIICRECHQLLHAGKLPDSRYRDKS